MAELCPGTLVPSQGVNIAICLSGASHAGQLSSSVQEWQRPLGSLDGFSRQQRYEAFQ